MVDFDLAAIPREIEGLDWIIFVERRQILIARECAAWPLCRRARLLMNLEKTAFTRCHIGKRIDAVADFDEVDLSADYIDADHMPYLHIFSLRVVCWLRRARLVVTWHEWWGRDYWQQYLGRPGRLAAALERWAVRCADHVIVDSQETMDRLRQEGIAAERISLVPLGADLDLIDATPPSPQHWDVLYAGRLIDHKRVDVLIDALAALRDRGHQPSCLIVGSGPEEARLQEQARRLGLAVTFAPTKDDQGEIWALMKSARVFAYPSTREGFGLCVLEAQACGTTVVTSDHPDNHGRHLVDDGVTGYLGPATAAELADSLALALGRPADLTALHDHVAGFSWGPRAEQLSQIYRQQARLRPGAPAERS